MAGNLNLNPQYNLNPSLYQVQQPYFAQNLNSYNPNMQGQFPAMQGVTYDQLKAQAEAKSKDNMIAQATKDYDVMEHPGVLVKNLLLCLAMSVGFTGFTNWLMSTSKKVPSYQNFTNAQDFAQTRLYKASGYLDQKVKASVVGRGLSRVSGAIKNGFSKIPVPNFIKEVYSRMKIGGIAVLDKQGMYSIGKGAEALNEAVEYLSQVPASQIKALQGLKKPSEVLKILEDFRLGKIRGPVAYNKLAPHFDDISAAALRKLNAGSSNFFDKIFTTRPNVNLALHKAKFFNGALNKSQGPLAKALQKFTALVGEASGGGVLGGKMALVMNALGLMTGFNAASNAEKGDKLKAFMEDYIGFTLGSYLMSFYVGTWFNKFLGVSELGLDKNAIFAAGKKLGVDMSQGRLQDAVIAYNKNYKDFRGLKNIADKFRNGQMSFDKAVSAAAKHNVVGAKNSKELLHNIEKALGGKNEAFFAGVRSDIKNALKSKLTLKSIFKANEYNKGGFLTRLGRYLVQKPLSVIGRVLSVGRYDLVHGAKFSPKSMFKFAKRFGGGFGRAVLVMFVLVEPFRKGFMKLSHLIFGKPKKSALDEENAKEKKETEQVQKVMNEQIQKQQMQNMQVNGQKQNIPLAQNLNYQTQNLPQTNILKQKLENPSASTIATSPLNDTMHAENFNRDNVPELVRTYIPSPMASPAALQADPREAEAEKALLRADAAERAAMNFLN